MFPGRPGSGGDAIGKISRGYGESTTNSGNQSYLLNEMTGSGVSNQNGNKMNQFSLLWSELESTQTRSEQASPFSGGAHEKLASAGSGRLSPFSSIVNQVHAPESWNDAHGSSSQSNSNLYQDVMDGRHSSRME